MRAMIVDSDQVSAWSVAERLVDAGFTVIGPARSSGEAVMLANLEQPEVAILSLDLESLGTGERLANLLQVRHSTHCILTGGANERRHAADVPLLDREDHGAIADAVVRHRERRR